MSVQNRDLGPSLQRESYQCLIGGQGSSQLPIATGVTLALCIVPFPANLAAAQIMGYGVSGSPTAQFDVTRFLSAGVTTITGMVSAMTVVGATITQTAGFTVSSGASLVALYPNDIISLRTGGSNAAMTTATVTLVLQALQDIKTHFGV